MSEIAHYPVQPPIARSRIVSEVGYHAVAGLSGRAVVVGDGDHRWRVEIAYPVLTQLEFAPLRAFLLAHQDGTPFELALPVVGEVVSEVRLPSMPGGVALQAEPAVAGAIALTLSLASGAVDSTDLTDLATRLVGAYLRPPGQVKSYLITAASVEARRRIVVRVFPPLRAGVAAGVRFPFEPVPGGGLRLRTAFHLRLVPDQRLRWRVGTSEAVVDRLAVALVEAL